MPTQREIGLYRAAAFPYRWKKEKVSLANVSAVDTVVLLRDGSYSLFSAMRIVPPQPSELWLSYSESLFAGRIAGVIFLDNGRYVRPSQASSTSLHCDVAEQGRGRCYGPPRASCRARCFL